jgi:hypothetical protein
LLVALNIAVKDKVKKKNILQKINQSKFFNVIKKISWRSIIPNRFVIRIIIIVLCLLICGYIVIRYANFGTNSGIEFFFEDSANFIHIDRNCKSGEHTGGIKLINAREVFEQATSPENVAQRTNGISWCGACINNTNMKSITDSISNYTLLKWGTNNRDSLVNISQTIIWCFDGVKDKYKWNRTDQCRYYFKDVSNCIEFYFHNMNNMKLGNIAQFMGSIVPIYGHKQYVDEYCDYLISKYYEYFKDDYNWRNLEDAKTFFQSDYNQDEFYWHASENWDIGTYRNYKKNIQIAMRQSIS